MSWKRIKQKQDPDWVEYHKKAETTKFGKVNMKLWVNFNGDHCFVAVSKKDGSRHTPCIDAHSMDNAKEQAEKWAMNN